MGFQNASFLTDSLSTSLGLKEVDIKLEKAHRARGPKPKAAVAPPRSIIARFLDLNVKQKVLLQAWKKRTIQFQEHTLYFDHDYSPDLQRKRKKVQEVIKKLKEVSISSPDKTLLGWWHKTVYLAPGGTLNIERIWHRNSNGRLGNIGKGADMRGMVNTAEPEEEPTAESSRD